MNWKRNPAPAVSRQLIALARQATDDRPASPGGWTALANLLAQTGREEEAVAVLRRSLAHLSEEPSLRGALAWSLRRA